MIKNYIRKLLKEILQEGDFQPDISKYEVNNYKQKDTIWKVVQTQKVHKYEIKVEYIDDNEQEMTFNVEFNTASELNQYCEKNYLETLPGDARYIKVVYLYTWYRYKGKNKLESKLFTDYGKLYDLHMVEDIHKEIIDWFYRHPEYLLWCQ